MTSSIAATNPYASTLVTASGGAVRTRGGQAVGTGFDAALAQTQKPSAPISLLPEKQDSEVKVARSYKMESAQDATRVNEGEGYGFNDLVDLLNPLQHIPVVGSIYRALTGDEIRPDIKVAGGFLLGAATGGILLGAAAGIANATFEESTGKEPVIELAESFFGGDHAGPENLEEKNIQLAQATVADIPVPQAAPVTPVKHEAVEVTLPTAAKPEASANIVAEAAASVKSATNLAAAQAAAPAHIRVGNTLYTSPQMKVAARAAVAPSASNDPATTTPAKGQLDSQTLGALLHQQAQTHEKGDPLPPELVQDMMLMALDKYKAAQANLPAAAAIP